MGVCTAAKHEIETEDAHPVQHTPYPSAWKELILVGTQCQEIEKAEVIEKLTSP